MLSASSTSRSMLAASRPQMLRRQQQSRPTRTRSSVQVSAHSITFQSPTTGKTQTIECAPDEYVLDAAQAAGIVLPHSCTAGTCCACAVKVVDGKLDTSNQVYLDDVQLAAGFALICSSLPLSDCTLLTHQEENVHTVVYAEKVTMVPGLSA